MDLVSLGGIEGRDLLTSGVASTIAPPDDLTGVSSTSPSIFVRFRGGNCDEDA